MKKKIKVLLMIIVLCFPFFTVQAKEKENLVEEKTEEVVIVENGDYKAGDNLTTEGNFLGSVFYAGNNVTSKSIVDGIGFLAGNNVTIEGEKEYLAAAGNTVFLNGKVLDDAFVIGNSVHISGIIERDLYVAASTVIVNGTIGRNVRIIASEVTLKGSVVGNIEINASVINIEDTTTISGTLKYNKDALIEQGEKASINSIVEYEVENNITTSEIIKNSIYSFLTSYANLLIVALVITYLFPKLFISIKKDYGKIKLDDCVRLFIKGLLALIGIPSLALILLMSNVGISLGAIILVMYFILSYISVIISGYLLGYFIWKKILKKESNQYIQLLIGIAVIKILEWVPYIGMIVSIISLFVGLGIIIEKIIFKPKELK